MKSSKSLVSCLLLAATTHWVSAGDLVVRLLADHTAEDQGQVRLISGSKQSDPLDIPTNSLSAKLLAPGRSFEIRPSEGGASLAEVALPENGDSFVVLLSTAEEGFAPAVVPADDASFKGGEMYFFNNTGKTIVGKIGETEIEIASGTGQIVVPKTEAGASVYGVTLSVREESGDKSFSKTSWPIDAKLRSYVLFYVDPNRDRVTYRAIDEFVGN